MKLLLNTLFGVFLILSGLMFMRVILHMAHVSSAVGWAKPIFTITDVFAAPIAMLMFGGVKPDSVLNGTSAIVEPHVVIALFGFLILAFIASSLCGSGEKIDTSGLPGGSHAKKDR